MRIVSVLLLAAGTILGALGGARLPEIDMTLTVVAMGLLLVGAVLFRLADRAAMQAAAAAGSNDAIEEALRELPVRLDALVAEAADLSLEELVERLGAIETSLLLPIGEAVPRFLPTLGGQRFAEIFGAYSAGERLVRRAWSAAADQHRTEALTCLEAGAARIRTALAALAETAPRVA